MIDVVGDVLIDGVAVPAQDACVSVFDIGFQRGYGCFEAMRAYGGTIFRLDAHLDRLAHSAAALHLPLPDRGSLAGWCTTVADGARDAVVRLFVSGGVDPVHPGIGSKIVVYAERPPAVPRALRVGSRLAPWHPDGARSELTGAKILSYGFNLAAALAARRDGFDDALLIGRDGDVLEGPTFSVAWFHGDTLRTPSLELGILASITRSAVLDLAAASGIEVEQGRYALDEVLAADEVFAMSTVKEVLPVGAIDARRFDPGARTARLAAAFRKLVAAETGR